VTIDCHDPERLAQFWSSLLGRGTSVPLPGWIRLDGASDAEAVINFQPVPEPKRDKARIHLDITVDAIGAAIRRVEELGGAGTGQRHHYVEGVVAVMADPEGNEFCLVQYFE
jgi:predicted enzyme related to lactoylglutathione lyase